MKSLKHIRDNPVIQLIYKMEHFIAIVTLTIIIALTFYNIILRFVFRTGKLWIEEFVSFLLVLLVMLGMAIGVREKSHSAMESFVCRLPKSLQKAVYLIDGLIVAVFLGVATYGGFRFLKVVRGQTMVVLRWPVAIMYSFIVIGCLIALVEHVMNVIEDVAADECRFIPLEEQMWEEQSK